MAELVEELLGEALVAAFRNLRHALRDASEQTLAWLREMAQPPPNVRLTSEDGTTFTGVVLVERSDVVVMLAARHPPTFPHQRAPKSPPPYPRGGMTLADQLDPDDPRWDRDINPFHR